MSALDTIAWLVTKRNSTKKKRQPYIELWSNYSTTFEWRKRYQRCGIAKNRAPKCTVFHISDLLCISSTSSKIFIIEFVYKIFIAHKCSLKSNQHYDTREYGYKRRNYGSHVYDLDPIRKRFQTHGYFYKVFSTLENPRTHLGQEFALSARVSVISAKNATNIPVARGYTPNIGTYIHSPHPLVKEVVGAAVLPRLCRMTAANSLSN